MVSLSHLDGLNCLIDFRHSIASQADERRTALRLSAQNPELLERDGSVGIPEEAGHGGTRRLLVDDQHFIDHNSGMLLGGPAFVRGCFVRLILSASVSVTRTK
jgi:hypothetical protein